MEIPKEFKKIQECIKAALNNISLFAPTYTELVQWTCPVHSIFITGQYPEVPTRYL
jgi:hypothetical protein